MSRMFFVAVLVVTLFTKVWGQAPDCGAYFTYSYQPWLTQPEEPIYLFADSSWGEDAATTYLWSFGTGDFSGVRNPAFTYDPEDSGFEQVCLTIHDTDNNCTSQYCDTIRVDNLCIGARYTYSQQGNVLIFKADICGQWDSISWNFGDGTMADAGDTVTHTYAAGVDSYYVCMQVFLNSECQYFYPCKSIDCQQIYIYPTGIAAISDATERLKIYPDPVSNTFSIMAGQTGFPVQVCVTDVTGNILLNEPAASATQQLNISNLAAGVYFVQITNAGQQKLVTRFVKQ